VNGRKSNRRRARSRSGSMGSMDSGHSNNQRTKPSSSSSVSSGITSGGGDALNSIDDSGGVGGVDTVYIPSNYKWESRQMDHKKKDRSGSTSSSSSSSSTPSSITTVIPTTTEERQKMEWDEIQAIGRNVVFRSLGEDERKSLLLRDDGSTSKDNETHQLDDTSTTSTATATAATTTNNNHHQTYSTTDIKHVRNELEQIRISRFSKDAAGCSCRKFSLPQQKQRNKNGGGGGSTTRSRSSSWGCTTAGNERKVREELRKRKIPVDDGMQREDLVNLLMDAVDREGCCYGNDCLCFRNGVVCQVDTCSCWSNNVDHGSAGGSGSGSSITTQERYTVDEIQKLCGNSVGMYVVDFDKVAEHRHKFLRAAKDGLCGNASN